MGKLPYVRVWYAVVHYVLFEQQGSRMGWSRMSQELTLAFPVQIQIDNDAYVTAQMSLEDIILSCSMGFMCRLESTVSVMGYFHV